MSKKYMYVYKYYPQYEESMALCEFENIFHEPYEKYFFTDYDYDYKRSVFIKERLTIFKESNDPEEIIAYLKDAHLYYENFKVIFYKNDEVHVPYEERLSLCHRLSEPIAGTTKLHEPDVELAITKLNNIYYFGLLERNRDWHRYEVKPHSYSHSLPLKVARCALNLGVGNDLSQSIIDPCCGVGTVVLEGLAMGLNIRGSDINRWVSYKARLNLEHFGYDPLLIEKKDIHDIKEQYDLCILDVPYGVYSNCSVDDQLLLINATKSFCKRLVVITHENYKERIASLGFVIRNQCMYKRGNFERYITLCEVKK